MHIEIMNKHYEQIEEHLKTSAEGLQTLKANNKHLMQWTATINFLLAGKAGSKK